METKKEIKTVEEYNAEINRLMSIVNDRTDIIYAIDVPDFIACKEDGDMGRSYYSNKTRRKIKRKLKEAGIPNSEIIAEQLFTKTFLNLDNLDLSILLEPRDKNYKE